LIAAQNEACEDDNKEMNKSRYAWTYRFFLIIA
jgi:hypothetical protein